MATIIERLRGRNIAKDVMDAVFIRNQSIEGITTESVEAYPYKKSDLAYICISTTNRAIGQIPILVFKEAGEGEWVPLPSKDPWQNVFEKPNYLLDRYSFVESIVGFLMLEGDIFIIPFPPGLEIPVSMWLARKKFIGPIKDPKTGHLIGWNYNPKGVTMDSTGGSVIGPDSIPLSREEVCHIYFWNPYDPIMGMAPSEAGSLNIKIDYKASYYTMNFFDEGAVPGGMLETERSLTDKQFNRIKEQFDSRHGGYKKSHRFALLENGLKYTQTGLSQKDMEFPKLRDHSARRIMQIYGMKEAVISETRSVNFATSREERKEWWETTNLPIMRMITSALNSVLFKNNNGTRLACQFDYSSIEALREALKEKAETGYRFWQMGFPVNEINKRLGFGFKKVKWGNTWYMPINLIPVEDYEKPPEPSQTQPPPKEDLFWNERKLLENKTPADERNEVIWNGIIRQVAPIEESFTKKVSRVFYDMRRKTLDLLYKSAFIGVMKNEDDVENELYKEESHDLEKLTAALFLLALMLGSTSVSEEAGFEIAFSETDPEAINFLMNKKLKIRNITQTIRNQIQKELVEGYKAGETIDQIADRIRGVFDVAKSRAKTIARTEIMSSVNEGRYVAIRRSGFKRKSWFTALDERVRLQHRPMHGRTISVNENWVMPDGSILRHPGDYNAPAHQIVNCRCVEIIDPTSSQE